jgi:transcriptional regulator NrdR family protein
MNCPLCQTRLTTTNSRKTAAGASTWRRKHCSNCERTFTSRESIDLSDIIQIDGAPYSRNQLTSKLAKLTSKSSEEDLTSIVETIESRLLKLSRHDHSVTNQIFSSEIMTVLEKLDRSAYLRYRAEVEES